MAIIIALYLINTIFAFYIFYSKKRYDISKKCWIFILCILPAIGPIIFLTFGFIPWRHKSREKEITDYQNKMYDYFKINDSINSENEIIKSVNNIYNSFGYKSFVQGNVKELDSCEHMYEETINLIRSAKKNILIQYYIIGDSVFLKSLVNELLIKAKEGVNIYLLYDWVGSRKKHNKKIFKELEKYGVLVKTFKPRETIMITSKDNSRSHKKVIIVDNMKALYGGSNISDEYINLSKKYEYWRDNNFIVKGQAVQLLTINFLTDWKFYTDSNETNIDEVVKKNKLSFDKKENKNEILILNSFPEFKKTWMLNLIPLLFSKAKKRILIYTPYLYLLENISDLLSNAARSGIEVKIILPGLKDNKWFIIKMNQSQYKKLIEAGVGIYESDSFLHTKTIIIDNDISLVGTVNLDLRAMVVNYESLTIINSKELNNNLSKQFHSELNHSTEYTLDKINEFSLSRKIIMNILLLFEPIL